ncbi:NADP-dependent 3-hydroxy acid dehydrogenase YdfG [Amycolatopsis xylanica]|uniref:NADP-dependent 3-hydroxy acid dehydrogenase YdfG n=1 Tax=Amycolatopsis xylanica TaxID=589385 RepID=A0A1H3RGH7_9PSEU|nr:SDR family NAD(P)-dependent oxidoreductase [Amycolatopsis xylanica]SDZ24766.1 NADP-dependent 3-hydroxy acid dehydrogenase YdfG [Amycolatopsis xylanica]
MTNTDGRVWLITGCSAGFGREIALAALAAGDRVLATSRRPETLADLEGKGGDRIRTAALDVTDAGQVAAAVKTAIEAFGRIDVVVNNVGHGAPGAIHELAMSELRTLMDVMFFGAVELTKAALPHLRAQGDGTIVQISSIGGQVSSPGFGAHSAAKFALEGLSEALSAEAAEFGVRVLIVEPGEFRTEAGGTQPGDPAKAAAAVLRAVGCPNRPLRLALGADAVDTIRAHHEAIATDLANWEKVSRGTDIE